MTTIANVDVGLHLIGGNANLTFIFFIAFVLLGVLGLRFSFYAYRNNAATSLEGQSRLWQTLTFVGGTGALFALLGVVDIASSIQTPYRRGLLLANLFFLTFAVRMLCLDATPAGSGGPTANEYRKYGWLLGGLAVVVVAVAVSVDANGVWTDALEGVSGLGFAVAGFAVGRRGIATSRVQGTVIDTLVRHLLPVLLFAALVPITELAVVAGVDRIIILHTQVVFIIMTATAMMTATIKLRQNLAGL